MKSMQRCSEPKTIILNMYRTMQRIDGNLDRVEVNTRPFFIPLGVVPAIRSSDYFLLYLQGDDDPVVMGPFDSRCGIHVFIAIGDALELVVESEYRVVIGLRNRTDGIVYLSKRHRPDKVAEIAACLGLTKDEIDNSSGLGNALGR